MENEKLFADTKTAAEPKTEAVFDVLKATFGDQICDAETEAKTEAKTEAVFFNAESDQRFAFEVTESGGKFDTAHLFKCLTDERYLEYLKAANIKGDEDNVEENELEITVSLWNDLIIEVENIEVEEGADWKALIDSKEKEDAIDKLLVVAIVEPEEKATGKRQLSAKSTEKVTTEAYFNGLPVQQTHRLEKKRDEWQKKYNRIQARRIQPEPTRGLRGKPKMKYVDQEENIGKLYDEMFVEQTGFAAGVIPLRFKSRVLHYLYGGSKLSEKK